MGLGFRVLGPRLRATAAQRRKQESGAPSSLMKRGSLLKGAPFLWFGPSKTLSPKGPKHGILLKPGF